MLKRLLVASLGIFFAAALEKDANGKPFDCGTDTAHASTEFLSSIQSLHGDKNQGSSAARAALVSRGTNKDNNSAISIEAVFHIVTTNANKNAIKQDMPKKQLDSLNDSYKPYGIQFTLKNTTWTTNDKWAVGATADDTAMKKALRQGTYRTLNIYFQTDLAGGVLGRCTLPSNVANGKSDPSVYFSDGCNVNANTMPSGAMDGYNFGKTAVHETGHWLGLLHTFEGYSCDGPGDYIDDTPMESESTDGCPMDPPKQTCPNQPGNDKNDPIHNYMDYSIDECYEGFTPKQHDRMHYLYNMYRDGN